MIRKPVFRIVKEPNRDWYRVERRDLFKWKFVDSDSDLAKCRLVVGELEANPTSVIYQTGKV